MVIIVSNQTRSPHTLTLDGGDTPPTRSARSTRSTPAKIQQTLKPGQYTVKAGSAQAVTREIAPAHLIIGKPRPNSNDQVELP